MKKFLSTILIIILLIILYVTKINNINNISNINNINGNSYNFNAAHLIPINREIIDIPDAAFKNDLLEGLKSVTGYASGVQLIKSADYIKPRSEMNIYKDELELITEFNSLGGSNKIESDIIKNITGLEYMINLTRLNLSFEKIVDITPVSNLTQLRYLNLNYNSIINFTPLNNLSGITGNSLNISNQRIYNLDFEREEGTNLFKNSFNLSIINENGVNVEKTNLFELGIISGNNMYFLYNPLSLNLPSFTSTIKQIPVNFSIHLKLPNFKYGATVKVIGGENFLDDAIIKINHYKDDVQLNTRTLLRNEINPIGHSEFQIGTNENNEYESYETRVESNLPSTFVLTTTNQTSNETEDEYKGISYKKETVYEYIYVSPKISFTATKQWENAPTIKPTVTFDLYRNGIKLEGMSKTVSSATNSVTWDELDQTDINGNAYTYSVDEQEIAGYIKTKVNNTTIKNTRTRMDYELDLSINGGNKQSLPQTIQAKVIKVNINDAPTTYIKDTILTLNEGKTAYVVTENLEIIGSNYFKYEVEPITTITNYVKKENSSKGYYLDYISPKANFTATKTWVNGPTIKPDVTFDIYQNGVKLEGKSKQVNKATNKVTFTDLDLTDKNGVRYNYTVDEQPVFEHRKRIVSFNTIENSYIVYGTRYVKNLIINGGPNIKPPVTLRLKRNGVLLQDKIQTINLGENSETTFTFLNIPKTDQYANNYVYDVEVDPIENYSITRDRNQNVILTYVPPRDEIVVNKVFIGGNENSRPQVILQVKKDGLIMEEKPAINTGDNINYKAIFDLPRTENDGSTINYLVDEKVVPENFEKSISGMTVTNTYVSPKTNISRQLTRENGQPILVNVYLTRNGEIVEGSQRSVQSDSNVVYRNLDLTNEFESRYNYEVVIDKLTTKLPNGYTFNTKNTGADIIYTPLKYEYIKEIPVIGGTKTNLPNTINVTLNENVVVNEFGEDEELDFELKTKMVTAKLKEDKSAYVVREIVNKTTIDGKENEHDVVAITNIENYNKYPSRYVYVSPKINFEKMVTKENGQPVLVKVQLTRNSEVIEPVNELIINTGEIAAFGNLPQTNENGIPYTYGIRILENEENPLPNGYEIVDENKVVYTPTTKKFTLNIPVNGGNKAVLPSTINVELTNDKNLPNKTVTATLNQDKTAYVIDENVQETTNNAENITYIARALTNIPNYTLLNNTYTYVSPNGTIERTVGRENGQPQLITVELIKNGVKTGQTVQIKSGEVARFENQQLTNENGVNNTYTISVNTTLTNGYSVRNNNSENPVVTYTSLKTNFTIEKVWQGGDTLIPDTIEVKIKRKTQENSNYTDVKTVILRKANNWQLNVTDLDKTDSNANVYSYVIEEVTRIANFTGSVNNFRITNTYTSPNQTVTKQVTITTGGTTKPTVKVVLVVNGQEVTGSEQTVNLNDTNTVNWENKPTTNNDGTPITYTLKVKEIVTNPNNNNGTYTITDDTITFVPNKITVNGSVQIVGARALWQNVEYALFKNGVEVPNTTKTITVSDLERANNNTVVINYPELDKVTLNNEVINYEIKASTNIDKFNKNVTENNTVYTYNNETTNIPYIINVVNGPNTVPSITVRVKETGQTEILETNTVGNNTTRNIIGTFENREARDSITGTAKSYTVEVVAPTNYQLTNNGNNTFTLAYVSPKTTVTGIKQWENGPSIKPTVTFDLYRNNVKVEGQSKVVPSSTNRVTWDNLEQTDINGNAYTYSVDEQSVTGYIKTKVNDTTIKNTYVVESEKYEKTITIIGGPIEKPYIYFRLKRNGIFIMRKYVGLDSVNSISFGDLPKTDRLGNEFIYDLEVENAENYVVSRDINGNVILTYVPPTGEIIVNKVFSGGSTTNRPSVTLQVKKNDQVVEEKVAVNTGDNINYRSTFNLPRTENDGSQITYTVDEKVVPVNFVKSITGMTVTNTYVSPKTEVSYKVVRNNGENIDVPVYLIKNDNKVDGTNKNINTNNVEYNNLDLTDNEENVYNYKIGVNENELPNGYTAVVNHNTKTIAVNYVSPEKLIDVNIPVNNGNKDLIPNTIEVSITNDKNLPNKTVTATLNDTKTAYVINDVSVDLTNNNAETVNYTIKAVTPITNYVLNDTRTEYNYVSPKVNKEIVVNRVGGKEQTVEFRIRQNNEVLNPDSKVSIKAINTRATNTFTNLDKTNIAGVDYTYTTESLTTLPNGYTIVKDSEFEYTIKYVSPQTKTITIDKVWNGGSTLIPDTIEVKIKRRTQTNRNYTDVKTVLLRKDNNWQLVVNNLENTDENEEIYEYAIEEVTRIANFTGSVNNFRITNTYTSPNQTVTKQVAITTGGDNKPTVKVVLVANGQEVTRSEQTVNLNDTNIVNWENKPTTNNDGTPIIYTLKVKEIVTNPNNDNGTYTITDDTITFVPNKITVNGSVQIVGARALWQDVQVSLFKNGVEVPNTTKTITVNDLERANNTLVLINYPELDKVTLNNEVINYEIKASTNIDKFNKNVTENNTVYTYTSETINVPYTVNITGGGSVPNITVRLKNGNTIVNTHNLNGQTAGTFTNVPLRDSITGNPINYTVEYTLPSEYVKQDDGSYKYVSPKKDVIANISFVNGKAPRPNVEVQLLRNGQTVPGVNNVILQNGQTSYTFTNLDKTNEQGVDYTYSINIVNNVEDYTKSYPNNLNAVLTYVQRVGEKQFTINREGGESVPVTINLVKNGEVSTNPADTKVVNTGNTVTYTNLELTDINGNTNTYNIVVTKLPDGYTGVINNDGTINVKYTSPKIDIEVNKIWVNGDTLVPNEIEVKLQRRVKGTNSQFTDVQTFTVTKDNNWSKTITNLDKTNESAKVYEYKVVEVTEIENFTGSVNNFEITNTYTSPRGNKEFVVNVVGKDVTLPIVLTKDGQKVPNTEKTTNGGTVTYTNLDLTNSDGTTIDYKLDIDMDKLSDEIKNRYDITKDTNGNITVTYKPERTDITKQVNIPENLKDTLKFVEVELVENGKPTGIIKQIPITDFVNSTTNTKLLTNDVTFTNVNKTDINGNTINYDINLVTNIPGYEITKDTNGNIVIKKIIEQKDIIANVNFDGGQLRPNVVIELIKDNKVIKTMKTSSSGNINFGKQDITDEYGNTIEYTFNVQNKNELRNKNYNTKVVKNSITLEYISPKINIDYKLILQGGVKEELPKIQVQLLQNGNPIGNTVTLDENLRYVFENMDETNKDGIKYNYSVVVIGDIQGYEVINVNNNVSILRRKIGESVNTPNAGFLPYAGAENNIAFSIMLIIGIYVGSKTFVRTRKSFGVKNINKRGLRRK